MVVSKKTFGGFMELIEVKKKKHVIIPTPIREGYRFLGWFFDDTLDTPYNGKIKKGQQYTLYAKWQEIEGEDAYTKDERIDKILRELNIRSSQTETSQANNVSQEEKPMVEQEKTPEEKTHEDLMKEIIARATEVAKSSKNSQKQDDEV